MPTLANVALTDTFDTWRIRTNQIIVSLNSIDSNSTNGLLISGYAATTANVGYDKANSAATTANSAYNQANTGYTQANTGYNQANTAYIVANNAYGKANAANILAYNSSIIASAGFDQANTGYTQANLVFGFTNTSYTQANTAYNQANLVYGQANTGYSQANLVFGFTNTAYNQANTGYTQANLVFGVANGAYNKANASVQNNSTTLITTGYTVFSYNAGANVSAYGTWTPDPANSNYQYATSNGAVTLAAPSNNCSMDILYTNNVNAKTLTFTGFTVDANNAGDNYNTTNGNRFIIMIRRINNVSTYIIKAIQA